ncbi:MAG: soluble lytic murein transglycosylase-like protein [Methylophagaceae bacterium]|jgi:soluble lytic murein transglycosylase-like protein
MLRFKLTLISSAVLFPALVWSAEPIQTIYADDGAVEFSNISSKKSAAKTTFIYKSKSHSIVTFSDQKPINTEYEVLRFNCYACNPSSTINWNTVQLNTTDYADLVKLSANTHAVDPALVRALIHAESHFNPNAKSHVGAQGLMQLMPATAKELGVKNAFNAQQNIQGGVKYLAQLLTTFNGDITLATAAYNAGPNAVKKYKGVPPYTETKVYVERVGILYRRYQHSS